MEIPLGEAIEKVQGRGKLVIKQTLINRLKGLEQQIKDRQYITAQRNISLVISWIEAQKNKKT